MDFILEIIFDLIVEGSIGAVGDKKVPILFRILAAVLLIVVFGGIVGVCIFIGINEIDPVPIILGVVVLLLIIGAVWRTVKRHRK